MVSNCIIWIITAGEAMEGRLVSRMKAQVMVMSDLELYDGASLDANFKFICE